MASIRDGRRTVVSVAVRCAVAFLAIASPRPAAGQQNASSSSSSSPPPPLSSFANGFPENFTSSTDAAIDVQYTSCKVITDRIVATAEGKFSRFCHGICNINETNARLHRIETLLTANAESTKQRLFQLERILLDGIHISSRADGGGGGKQLSAAAAADTGRLREIGVYNGTVFSADGGPSAFVYYWRVHPFWRLALADSRARSPPFYVSPRSYRVALTVDSDVAARTVRVAATVAAGEFDAQLAWPLARRLRLSVLDQTDAAPEDIVSRVWDDVRCGGGGGGGGVCASMEIRHDVLAYRRYAAGDALIVKLTVFLE